MIKTILTATDGSEQADSALELSADLAGKYGAKLIIMHVIESDDIPAELRHMAEVEHITKPDAAENTVAQTSVPVGNPARLRQNTEIHAYISNELLKRAKRSAVNKGADDILQISEQGDPAKRILKAVRKHDVDMVVMGSRGLGNLKGLLVGSVSNKVSNLAKCTCVTVR